MEVSVIKEVCLKGSKTYYNYLSSKPNGGVEEVDISMIEQINLETFKIKVTKKLFDIDSVCFSYNGKVRKLFTAEDIQLKVYDNDKKILVVKVSNEVKPFISTLNYREWKLVIDLKFLVQRVIDWYESNGHLINLSNKTKTSIKFNRNVLFNENGFIPSVEQLKAIEMIFSNPFSYVWGAPGTGKTRFVLSYSILSYVKQKKKILVLAPTNVALEQVLSGIIEMTDKAGLERNKILRLGFPSQEFANEYGEICEIQGLEKELKRVNSQIKILSSILGIENDRELELKNQITLIKDLITQKNGVNSKSAILSDLTAKQDSSLSKSRGIERQIEILVKEENYLIKKKNSILAKVFSFLSKQIDYDKEIFLISEKKNSLTNVLINEEKTSKDYESQITSLNAEISKLQKDVNTTADFLVEIGLIEGTLNSDLSKALKNLEERLSIELENSQIYRSLSEEYSNLSPTQLEFLLNQFKAEQKRLENYSLESRIENALVVGATIDTYLHRFKEKRTDFAHVFLDEAGYASVVKSLTIFISSSPVTFLGDHKQLPPVCELSKLEIRKNEKYREVFVWDQSAIFISDFCKSDDLNSALKIYLNNQTPSAQNLPTSSLTESFRFGPNLAQVLDHYVYDEGFSSKKSINTEIIICNVANPPSARGRGRLNEAEAITIESLVKQNFNINDSVAILTPYRDQVKELKKRLPDFKDENKILTVHKSQGREWDTVIYSVCDIGNGRSPWFTDSTNSLSNGLNNVNTAVSRAKKRLIICCCKDEWMNMNNQLVKGLLDARTKEIVYDSSKYNFSNTQGVYRPPSTRKSPNDNSPKVSNVNKIKSKTYVPEKDDEEWESKTLYWSKLRKDGYTYSAKKDAWWKRK